MPKRERGQLLPNADVFTLDLNAALLAQLPAALEGLETAPLTKENLAKLGPEHGVYQLFHQGQPVYIGKSKQALRNRLGQHLNRCSGRYNIDLADMSFRCLYVDKFVDSASPESVLIERYQAQGKAPWNVKEGFAPKDVGRGRPDGRPGKWYLDRPVRHDCVIEVDGAGEPMPIEQALLAIKNAVPFDLFKFASQRSRLPKDQAMTEDYVGRTVTLASGPSPLMDHLANVLHQLPPGWQASIIPQGVFVYRESVDSPWNIDGWRRTETGLVELSPGDWHSQLAQDSGGDTPPSV
ncbi:GIY-YIG nuclease family protein [Angustibacter sp. Root456]|uniref:GIY-YIG nuclease family protein n=1 Tax=Angustibacter sp. Root456 TaxID=1736539 RepID=UPI0006FAEE78|nr:GIY-YIG nuclease family protein [Angustibacter sp. Root456]KQX65976.1 hypothetical protein ASD06_06145 [Angustibacter sp. Root456]